MLTVNFSLGISKVDATLDDVSLAFNELFLPRFEPLGNLIALSVQILDLLHLKHHGDMQLIELGHLLLLEVLDLFFRLGELLVNRTLLALHALLVVLQIRNIKLDGFLLII